MQIARLYDDRSDASTRVLVDRLWPRGLHRDDPRIDRWLAEVAPSRELRTWYGHRPELFEEFAARYRAELEAPAGAAAFAELVALAADGPITLVTATRDLEHSQAVVLAGLLDATTSGRSDG